MMIKKALRALALLFLSSSIAGTSPQQGDILEIQDFLNLRFSNTYIGQQNILRTLPRGTQVRVEEVTALHRNGRLSGNLGLRVSILGENHGLTPEQQGQVWIHFNHPTVPEGSSGRTPIRFIQRRSNEPVPHIGDRGVATAPARAVIAPPTNPGIPPSVSDQTRNARIIVNAIEGVNAKAPRVATAGSGAAPCTTCGVAQGPPTERARVVLPARAQVDQAIESFGQVGPDPYFRADGCWSRTRRGAANCAHPSWKDMSLQERGHFIRDSFMTLMQAHQFNYPPNVLTCLVFKESSFQANIRNPGPRATDSGLGQVIRSTADDVFRRYVNNPRNPNRITPRVQNFTEIRSGREYHDLMRTSPLAQLELTLMVFRAKQLDLRTNNISRIVAGYHGNPASGASQGYTQAVMNCARCLDQVSNGAVSERCLNLVHRAATQRRR
jgi:hypothetical protein